MKALVTGATGFLGRRVVDRLLAHGCEVRCFVRDVRKADTSLSSVEHCVGNLLYPEDCASAVKGVDVVFHAAAAKSGAPADLFLNSDVGSERLLRAIMEAGVKRVVLVSSFGVYGVADMPRNALITEDTPLETHPERRDPYSHSKLRQEKLFRDYVAHSGVELVIIRPGVIYGPGASHFSARVGLNLFGVFLHLGGNNVLPLTYVDNCAEAIVTAGLRAEAAGQIYNVADDELPTSRQYLRRYRAEVRKMKYISIPYGLLLLLARCNEHYYRHSNGQLPAVFTRYKCASTWAGNRFANTKLKSLGWKPPVSTDDALKRTFAAFRAELEGAHRSV